MESARRVGLPPAYEDADMDALCQLIGTCDLFPKKQIVIKSLHDNSAHARPPDIHQRPYSSFTVRVHTCPPEHPHTPRSDFSLFFFSFLSIFSHGLAILFLRFFMARIYACTVIRRCPVHLTQPRESISPFHSASIPQISILDYLRRIVRFTNLEVCLSPLHRPLLHPTKRTWLTSTFPLLRWNDHRRPAYSSSYTTSTRSARASRPSLYPP